MLYFLIPLSIFFLGTIYGSFLNVIIYRLPLNKSIITPRSFCFNCKSTIPFYNNIPLLSFLIQKGKCFNCKINISYQYPIIECLTGWLFVLSYYYVYPINPIESIFFCIISGLLLSIALIDYKFFVIPLSLIITILIINTIFIIFFSNKLFYSHFYGSLYGLGYLSIVFIITWLMTKKQPMGFGDLQLIIILGLWLGTFKVLLTIFFGSILGLVYFVVISTLKNNNNNIKLPFGTFLCIAAIIFYLIPANWEFI